MIYLSQFDPRKRYLTGYPSAAKRRRAEAFRRVNALLGQMPPLFDPRARYLTGLGQIPRIPTRKPPAFPDVPPPEIKAMPSYIPKPGSGQAPLIVFTPAQGPPPPPDAVTAATASWQDQEVIPGVKNKHLLWVGGGVVLLSLLRGRRR